MKILVVDSRGRGATLAEKYLKNKNVTEVLVVPGNDLLLTNKKVKIFPDVKLSEISKILQIAKSEKVDLVDVAQDDAIAKGLVDLLQKSKVKTFGPTKKASQIEWDKAFARKFMKKFKLPIPVYKVFKSQKLAINYLKIKKDQEYFVKAAGLAGGKGAVYARNRIEAIDAVKGMVEFGSSGKTFLLEEKLNGEEFSAFAMVNGRKFAILGYAQDHKTAYDGNLGPNTGGMGCSSPPLVITSKIEKQIDLIFKKTVNGLVKLNRSYLGILYLGGIIENGKVKIIEFNARWGDPEAQVVIPSIKNDYLELVLSAINGKIKKITNDKVYRIVVTAASKGYPIDHSKVIGREIKGLDKLLKSKIKVYGAQALRKGKKYIAGGGRLFYVLGEGKDVVQARKKAYNALSKLSISGDNLHYRKDIGYRDLERFTRKK